MNFLGMGPMEILLIVVLALIVFGPAKLPEIMGQVGKAIGDFRRATSELSDEFNRTIHAEIQETKAIVDDTKSTVTGSYADINAAITGTPTQTATTAAPALAAAAPANGLSNGANGWSHETAAPAPTQPAVEVGAAEAAPQTPGVASEPAAAPPAQPVAPRKAPRRDDLLPPY